MESQPWIVLWRDQHQDASRPHHIFTGMFETKDEAVARVLHEDRNASIVSAIPGARLHDSVNEYIRGTSWNHNDPALLAEVEKAFARMLTWYSIDLAGRWWIVLYHTNDVPETIQAFPCHALTATDAQWKCRVAIEGATIVSTFQGTDVDEAMATYHALQAAQGKP